MKRVLAWCWRMPAQNVVPPMTVSVPSPLAVTAVGCTSTRKSRALATAGTCTITLSRLGIIVIPDNVAALVKLKPVPVGTPATGGVVTGGGPEPVGGVEPPGGVEPVGGVEP